MFNNTQYSLLNIQSYLTLNKYRGLWRYSLVLPQFTTNYGPLYQYWPSLWTIHTQKKEYLNTITLKATSYILLLESY